MAATVQADTRGSHLSGVRPHIPAHVGPLLQEKGGQLMHEQQPTQMKCPSRPKGDNSTHHMLPTQGGDMFCRYCRQSRAQILKED